MKPKRMVKSNLLLMRFVHLRFVGDFEFFDGDAVAPEAHEALLRGVAEGVFAVLAGEGSVAEGVEEFPGAVVIEGVYHHRLGTYASLDLRRIANRIRSAGR